MIVIDSFKALVGVCGRRRVSPLPPRLRRAALGLPGLVLLGRRVRRGRDRRGTRVRGRRRHHQPLDAASRPSARRAPSACSSCAGSEFAPGAARLPRRARRASTSSRGSPTRSTSPRYALDGRAALVRHRGPRRDARRRLLAGRLDALRRPLGLRQDADGPALHLQRRPSGRTGRAGDAPGAPDPARADRRAGSAGRSTRRASS